MNIGKIKQGILINRSKEKHKISDYKLASYVEHFWTRTKWPEYFFQYECKSTQEIIKNGLPKVLAMWLDYPARERGRRALERDFRKLDKKFQRELKLIIKARDPQRKKREYVHKYINTVKAFYQDMIDKEGWTPYYSKNRLKLHFGFVKIPKWIWQSDKQIDRKLDAIIDEITFSFHVKQQRIDPSHDCLDFDCPYCKIRKHHDTSNHTKKPIVGTNKWLDEQEFKKSRDAALRSKKPEFEEEQAREKEWNTLEESQDLKKRSTGGSVN